MSTYKAIVHYHLKKGMEEQGIKFLENELIKKAAEYGCHGIELWQNDRDPTNFIGTGLWNSLEEARKFQAMWQAKEKELMRYCSGAPTREFYKIRSTYKEKSKRVA
jgi:heme-degrading monooxygenase HmoA